MGNTKSPKYVDRKLREQVGKNVGREMDAWATEGNKTLALAQATRLSKSTIQRIVKGQVGVSIDTLSAIAETMSVPIYRFFLNDDERVAIIDARTFVGGSGTDHPGREQRRYHKASAAR